MIYVYFVSESLFKERNHITIYLDDTERLGIFWEYTFSQISWTWTDFEYIFSEKSIFANDSIQNIFIP